MGGDLVELLSVPIFEGAARVSASLTAPSSLLPELAARARREMGDRALASRRLLRLSDVALRCAYLLRARHRWLTPTADPGVTKGVGSEEAEVGSALPEPTISAFVSS